jgi:membrane protein
VSAPRAEKLSRGAELRAAVRLAVRRGWEDNLPQMAGSLAYTLVFAIFPALIFLVAVLDLAGWFMPAIEDAMRWVGEQPSDSPWRSLEAPLQAVLNGSTPAWAMLFFGGLTMLWAAGNYVGGYQWAVGRIRRIPAGHPFLKQRLIQYALAVGAFFVILIAVVAVFFTGPVAEHFGERIGLGDTTTLVWSWLRWPILFVVVAILFAVFYQVTPDARRRGSGLFTTGSVVAIVGWLATTAGFSAYVKYFGNYNRLYGTLGAFIAFLIWLYLFNVALLASTEIDAALEEVRAKTESAGKALPAAVPGAADAHAGATSGGEA